MIERLSLGLDAAVYLIKGASMDLKQLAEWVEARICAPCKQGYTCDDFDCDQAKKIADILRRMAPFKGKDDHGKDVSGWLVAD
jgi:hypothetical protein